MKLIKKYLQGKPILQSDSPELVAITTLGKDSPAGKYIRASNTNTLQIINGETPHYIFIDNPVAFNYNDDLMVRGSELLKYPLLYTHMGLINTKDSNILPDLYYKIGNNGYFDHTHFTPFNSSDTYTPIPDYYLQLVINLRITKNEKYGLERERNKQGTISKGKNNIYKELFWTGWSPGLDAAYLLYLRNPTDESADNLRSIYTTLGAGIRAVAGNHPVGAAVFAPTMGSDAYERLSNAKNWLDYVIGTGEGLMTLASLVTPLRLAYSSLKETLSPKYALSKAIDSTPLDVDMLNSYDLPLPLLHYYFSDWQTFKGAHPFEYLTEHIHDIDLSDIGTMLSRYGYFNNPKLGVFRIDAKLPSGKSVNLNKVETQPINYPVLVNSNPELPLGYWGKRGNRTTAERVINSSNVKNPESTNIATVAGFVTLDGKVHVTSSYPTSDYTTKSFPVLFNELNSNNPSYNIADEINKARKYWDSHAIIDDKAIPARDPFKKGNKKSYVPFSFSSHSIPVKNTIAPNIWQSGKLLTREYIMSSTHKDRLMNNLKLTEELANLFIQLELKNLDNVELINLGTYKIGRPFGYTIGYTVDGQSGPNIFSRILKRSKWLPDLWSELRYRSFIEPYSEHARTYDKAKKGITLVGVAEGDKPVKVNAGFEEGTHATTRGGTDPALSPIIEHDAKLAANLVGNNPTMLDPMEARTFFMELDRAWDAIKDNLPDYYNNMSYSAKRRQFFNDIFGVSKNSGKNFYENVPKEWLDLFDPAHNFILNKGVNGLKPNTASYRFWDEFVYNTMPQSNNINIT